MSARGGTAGGTHRRTGAIACIGTLMLTAVAAVAPLAAPAGAPAAHADAVAYTAYSRTGGTIAVTSPGGAKTRTLTPSSLASSDAAWSPDGRRIAFSATSGPMANIDVYVMAADGSGRRRLTLSPEADSNPTWSPDGTAIAFERDRACDAEGCGAQEVWVMRADGTRQRRLTSGSTLDGDPAWSPDGRHIAFVSRRGIGASALFTMRADGTTRKRITRPINADNPSWAPDGRTIAFDASLVSQPATGPQVNVYSIPTGGSASPRQLIADASDPAWSPDGSRLAYVTATQAIAAIPAAGGSATRLVAAGRYGAAQPAWQPRVSSLGAVGVMLVEHDSRPTLSPNDRNARR
jgi:Tol biopolymer transport system component